MAGGRRKLVGPVNYYELPRKHLQSLCKKYGFPANKSNQAMAEFLTAHVNSADNLNGDKNLDTSLGKSSADVVQSRDSVMEYEAEGVGPTMNSPDKAGVTVSAVVQAATPPSSLRSDSSQDSPVPISIMPYTCPVSPSDEFLVSNEEGLKLFVELDRYCLPKVDLRLPSGRLDYSSISGDRIGDCQAGSKTSLTGRVGEVLGSLEILEGTDRNLLLSSSHVVAGGRWMEGPSREENRENLLHPLAMTAPLGTSLFFPRTKSAMKASVLDPVIHQAPQAIEHLVSEVQRGDIVEEWGVDKEMTTTQACEGSEPTDIFSNYGESEVTIEKSSDEGAHNEGASEPMDSSKDFVHSVGKAVEDASMFEASEHKDSSTLDLSSERSPLKQLEDAESPEPSKQMHRGQQNSQDVECPPQGFVKKVVQLYEEEREQAGSARKSSYKSSPFAQSRRGATELRRASKLGHARREGVLADKRAMRMPTLSPSAPEAAETETVIQQGPGSINEEANDDEKSSHVATVVTAGEIEVNVRAEPEITPNSKVPTSESAIVQDEATETIGNPSSECHLEVFLSCFAENGDSSRKSISEGKVHHTGNDAYGVEGENETLQKDRLVQGRAEMISCSTSENSKAAGEETSCTSVVSSGVLQATTNDKEISGIQPEEERTAEGFAHLPPSVEESVLDLSWMNKPIQLPIRKLMNRTPKAERPFSANGRKLELMERASAASAKVRDTSRISAAGEGKVSSGPQMNILLDVDLNVPGRSTVLISPLNPGATKSWGILPRDSRDSENRSSPLDGEAEEHLDVQCNMQHSHIKSPTRTTTPKKLYNLLDITNSSVGIESTLENLGTSKSSSTLNEILHSSGGKENDRSKRLEQHKTPLTGRSKEKSLRAAELKAGNLREQILRKRRGMEQDLDSKSPLKQLALRSRLL